MDWYKGSIPDAVAEVKSRQKVLLVFVVGEDELSRKMASSYDDPAVSDRLNSKDCVALKLTVNSVPYQQFSQIYPVVVIPSSYFIGKNGMPIEIITGSLEPSEFVAKIDKIFQLNEESDSPLSGSTCTPNASQKDEPMESSESDPSGVVHNGCENSNQPSTSQSETATGGSTAVTEASTEEADSDVPLEDRVSRAKTLIEVRRQNKALEEQEDRVSSRKNCVSSLPVTESGRKRLKIEETENTPKEKKEELERRKLGQAVQQAQQQRHDDELKAWAQNRARDKEEERVARERVRQQIALDRAERAARYQQTKVEQATVEKEKENEMQRIKDDQEKAARTAALRSTMARLQFRLPDGTSVTHQFEADSTLQAARNFVIEEIRPDFSNFTLCTTFPRRHFTEADYEETLRNLQLAPSAAILILPGPAVTVASHQGGFLDSLVWMLVSPLLAVWRAITSLFRRGSQREATPPANEPEPGSSGTQTATAKKTPKTDESADERQAARKRNPQKFYQEGNVFRISNQQADDDDNNTYNGNSTQQM